MLTHKILFFFLLLSHLFRILIKKLSRPSFLFPLFTTKFATFSSPHTTRSKSSSKKFSPSMEKLFFRIQRSRDGENWKLKKNISNGWTDVLATLFPSSSALFHYKKTLLHNKKGLKCSRSSENGKKSERRVGKVFQTIPPLFACCETCTTNKNVSTLLIGSKKCLNIFFCCR